MDTIKNAFAKVRRIDFVPEPLKVQANIDAPLSIGFGQTISQPTTVAAMLGWLEPQPGDKILDIGSGSGWTSALLATIVGKTGKVYAVERIPELVELGRSNCQKIGIKNAAFYQAGNDYGLPRYSPYSCILVSASAATLPKELLNQLMVGGKLVIPVRNDILEITKKSFEEYETKVHPGFVFVPLI